VRDVLYLITKIHDVELRIIGPCSREIHFMPYYVRADETLIIWTTAIYALENMC